MYFFIEKAVVLASIACICVIDYCCCIGHIVSIAFIDSSSRSSQRERHVLHVHVKLRCSNFYESVCGVSVGRPRAYIDAVISAVVKYGCDLWYEIGRAIGLEASEVRAAADGIPSSKGQLLAVIDKRREQIDDDLMMAELLLDVCRNGLVDPIIVDVEQQLQCQGYNRM